MTERRVPMTVWVLIGWAALTAWSVPVEEPNIPDRQAVLTDFGAVADGQTDNTQAFARAIDTLAHAGGGRLIVPPGIWRTGPIRLRSRLDLHLQRGAVILFSDRFEDYPLIETTWEGLPRVRCASPIMAVEAEDIAITGEGVIDGSGQVWRPVKKFKMTAAQWQALVASGGVLNEKKDIWWPNEAALHGPERVAELEARQAPLEDYAPLRAYLRPVMVHLIKCRRVLLEGATFQNSPAWNLHPLLCEHLTVRNVTVRNPWYSQNGDGIDIESCRHVQVTQCSFDVGDDAICLKSGKDAYGRRRGVPTEDVTITDCVVYHGHGGVTIGSEMSGGVRQVRVRNCTFLGTDVGLRFKSTRGRGGVVEDIDIEDVRMVGIAGDAIRFNMFYGGQAPLPEGEEVTVDQEPAAAPVDEGTPRFRRIRMRNILCQGAERAVWLQGLPEMPIEEISFEQVTLRARQGVSCIDARSIRFQNVTIEAAEPTVFKLFNCRRLLLNDVDLPEPATSAIRCWGSRTAEILIDGRPLP